MNRMVKEWIRVHPIEAFFLIGIAFSFGTLYPAMNIIPQESSLSQIVSFYLGRIGVYSPVFTGMLIARVIQPGRQRIPLARKLLVFLPVWFIAASIQTVSLRLTAGDDMSLFALIVVSLPVGLLPAFVISAAFSGSKGAKQMLATLVRPQGKIVYYLFALLTFPVIHIVGTGITNIINGKAWFPQVEQGVELIFIVFVTFFSVLLFSGGINEEGGWRGFAQKRLQTKYSPLVANLIMWPLMVIWHIPNDIIQYQHGGYLMIRLGLYPFIIILFGWVYNRTGGSIWAPAMFHASMNAMNPLRGVFPITAAGNILLVGFAMVVVIADRLWRKLPEHHPAVDQAEKHAKVTGLATSNKGAVGAG